MEMKDPPKTKATAKATWITPIAIVVMLVCLAVIIATVELSKLSSFKFIADHRNSIVSIELAAFVMALVEFNWPGYYYQLPQARH